MKGFKSALLTGALFTGMGLSAGEVEDLKEELAKTKARIAELESKTEKENSILDNGDLSVTLGAFTDHINYKDRNTDLSDTPDEGYGSGYVDLSFSKKITDDLSFGVSFLGVERLYEDEENNFNEFYDSNYETRSIMYNLYLKYDFNESFITLGRQSIDDIFGQDPSLAAVVGFNEIENFSILGGVIKEQAVADYDEIIDWARVDSRADDGSQLGEIYFINTTITIPEIATITPYYYAQDEVADVYGANIAIEKELSDDLSIGLALDYNVIEDDTLNGETGYNYGITPSVTLGKFSLGLGYIKTSNDAVADRTVFGADYFDSMPEAEMAFANDAESLVANLEIAATDKLTIALSYGQTDYGVDETKVNSVEESLLGLTYAVSDNLELSASILNVDFKDNDEVDYYELCTGITYSF